MKKHSWPIIVGSLIFFIFSMTAAILAKPVYNRLERSIEEYTHAFAEILNEKTGLIVSYESFSPSIFSSFKINGIKLLNKNSREVITIKNTRVNYKLLQLVKGFEVSTFVRSVYVDGVIFNIDELVNLILQLNGSAETKTLTVEDSIEKEKEVPHINTDFDMSIISSFIPSNVNVENVYLAYEDKIVRADISIKDLHTFTSPRKGSVDFQLECTASCDVNNEHFTTGLYLNGAMLKNIDDSYVYIKITNLSNGTFTFNKLNFLATYKDYNIEVHSIQQVNPFYAAMSFDFRNLLMKVQAKTDNLNPMTVLSIAGHKDIVSELRKSKVTLDADYTWDAKDYSMVYNSVGKVFVPDYFVPGGAYADYSLTGDDKHLFIKHMDISGPKCKGELDLDFNYRNLQLNGLLDVQNFILPNGNTAYGEIYFDPLDKGFMLFSPQVFAGDAYLTALQANLIPNDKSFDFEIEVSDYSNAEYGEAGQLSLAGSYLTESNYIQSNVVLNSIYLGSALNIASQIVDDKTKNTLNGLKKTLDPYAFSCDLYFSTDFSSLSYNVPTLVLANTKVDNQFAFISVNGNEQNVQLNRFDLIYGKVAVNSSATLDINPDTKDLFFTLDAVNSSIPYHISGAKISDVITLSGDYGLDMELRLGKNLSGKAYMDNLPIQLGNIALLLSTDTNFNYSTQNGPSVQIIRFECEQSSIDTFVSPKLSFSGDVTKYGAQLNYLNYTDATSSLQGNADVALNMDEGIISSAGVNLKLKNPLSSESIALEASLSNPDMLAFSTENLMNSMYVSALADISHFSLNRFLNVKNDNNELTGTVSLSGTLEHPYGVVNVNKASMLLMDSIATMQGSVSLEDKDITINNINVDFSSWNVSNLAGNFSLADFTGQLNADFTTVGQTNFEIPLFINIEETDLGDDKKSLENAVVTIGSKALAGSIMKKPVDFFITAMYTPDMITFFSSENLGLVGMYSKDYGLEANLNTGDFISLGVSGSLTSGQNVLDLSHVNINLGKLFSFFNIDEFVSIDRGLIQGDVTLNGDFDTPDFQGELGIYDLNLALPLYLGEKLYTSNIVLIANNNELTLSESDLYIKNLKTAKVSADLSLNKWSLDKLNIRVATFKNQFIPLKFNSPYFSIAGDVSCDLDLILEDNIFDINGKVTGEKLDIVSDLQMVTSGGGSDNGQVTVVSDVPVVEKKTNPIGVRTDLNILLGTHVMVNFNPLLRFIFAPNTNASIKIDSQTGSYQIGGQLTLKSGDVAYLNRNFYIKEGSIRFNPQQITNPQITLRAETREKDDTGQNVRIILSAENQYLTTFNPRFSSIPAKSESEIRTLLGQIVMADSSKISDLLMSAGDYYFQSTLVRGLENKLRDFMNFDIFSVRTNILQNTLNMSVSGNLSKDKISIGNFLDNSTVYIGKYLGSALYVDAMLHLSLEDGDVNTITSAKGLLFQPEFGLEMELPIANIRWNMAPDINAMLNKQFVPSTSVSLSWKFTF